MRVFASRRVVDIHDLNCFRRRRKRGEPKLIFFGFSIDFKSIPSTNPPLQEQVHTHSEWEWSSTKKKKSRFKGEPRSRKRWENGFFLLIHTTTTTTSCALAASVSIHTHQVSFLFLFKCQNSENWKKIDAKDRSHLLLLEKLKLISSLTDWPDFWRENLHE